MVRKGDSGGSRELLSQEQQAAIDRYCRQGLRTLESDLPYDELFDVVG